MKDLSGWRVQRAVSFLAAALIAVMASAAGAQTAEEIMAKNIKAQGGRDALVGLKGLERKGEVKVDGAFGQMEGSVQETIIPGKKALRALDLAVFVQKDGWNGKVAWRDGMMGLQELEGQEANQIKQSAELNPFVKIDDGMKTEKLDDETVDDVAYYVIQMTPKEGPAVKIFVDKESDQIMRTTLKQNNPMFGEIEIVVETSGYEEFGPVKLPTKNRAQIGDVLDIQTTYTETKVNGDIDEAIFEKPMEKAAEKTEDKKDNKK
ncbi:MAG: hypothetical protein WD063_14410 [Pirellulales bacterium]